MRYKNFPSATRYIVGEDGIIMDRKTKIVVKPFVNEKGHSFVKVRNDDGIIVTIQVCFFNGKTLSIWKSRI